VCVIRAPFEGIYDLSLLRNTIVKLGLELVTVSTKDANINDIEDSIMKSVSSHFIGLIYSHRNIMNINDIEDSIMKSVSTHLGLIYSHRNIMNIINVSLDQFNSVSTVCLILLEFKCTCMSLSLDFNNLLLALRSSKELWIGLFVA
jgi:hypothetical protein